MCIYLEKYWISNTFLTAELKAAFCAGGTWVVKITPTTASIEALAYKMSYKIENFTRNLIIQFSIK